MFCLLMHIFFLNDVRAYVMAPGEEDLFHLPDLAFGKKKVYEVG